jgi:hypothetical protein
MMIEGSVDVSGSSVKIDDTEKISNYLLMANNAYDAENKLEAETYCNKVIEIDPNNYEAWLLKGKAAGWQSTLARLRIDEAVNCFTKAVDNAPEEVVDEVKQTASRETTSLTSALITMCCNNFKESPTNKNASDVVASALLMKRMGATLLLKCDAKVDDLSKSLATTINNAAMSAWNDSIYPAYRGEQHPSKYTWQRFVERGDAVIVMLKAAIDICSDDDDADAIRYSNMISVETKICDSASYKYDGQWGWNINCQLNQEEKGERNKMIMEWHKAWNKIDSSHIMPTVESVKEATNKTATNESNSYMFACIATIVIAIIAIMVGFMD